MVYHALGGAGGGGGNKAMSFGKSSAKVAKDSGQAHYI